MKVKLNKPILGYRTLPTGEIITRTLANEGDVLPVILTRTRGYICDSTTVTNLSIFVFPSQCSEVILEPKRIDEHAEEKYYHVYDNKNKLNVDDPFYNAFEFED